MLTEIKRPEVGPNADALTSLTRGRGPRRGNLEDLLKYWRPIMKKPGGFRRCVVILMDKPQFGGKPQRICAWLHHEITGKWPNEGKGKRGRGRGGKRRSRSVRRVRSAARRGKSASLLSQNEVIEVSPLRIAVRESRDFGGVLVQPIAGRQSAVDMKAAMFATYTAKVPVNGEVSEKRVGIFGSSSRAGQAAQAVGTIILPGDISDIRSPIRSQIYETLTPGGGRGLPSGRRLIRGTGRRGARNKFRCPPGFQKGGTFTNSQFSTCGAQILGIPAKGPGSPSSGAQRALASLARDASLVREIGDLRNNRSPYDIIRAAQIPVAPKKGSPTRRQISINGVLARVEEQDFSTRAVRRDGVILEPVVSLQALGKLDEFDDLADGTLIDRYESGQIGKDIVPAFSTGLRDVYVAVPDAGAVRVSRVGGELSPTEVESLRRVFPTSLRRAADLPDPTAAIRAYAGRTDGRLTVEFGELKNNKFEVNTTKNELIRVQTAGGKSLTVPRWVYETFLSRSAPRRAKDAPVYEIMSDEKTVNPFFVSTKTITSLTHRTANYHELIEVRAAIFAANREDIQTKRIGRGGGRGGRARALFDPNLNRFRCPPGTRYGGRITDQFGRNCGYSLPRTVINSLVDLGIRIEDAMEKRRQRRLERGSRRERLGAAIKEKYDNALNGLADVMDKLANVLDKTEDKRPGRIGPTLDERRNAAQLTDADKDLLSGEPLADALDNLKNVLDDQDFQNPDIPEIQKAYKAVEKAAGLEAGRLTDNPPKNEKDRSIGRRILDAIAGIMDRLANFVDPDTSRRDRRERRPAASAATAPKAPKKFDSPRKPEKLDNFSQLSIGGRRKKVDVPELRDLSDEDKSKVDNAVQAEFNELSAFWANRLGKGINDFSEKDIKKYLKANKNSKDARVERRRYNDWLELNELKRAQDDGNFDGDYEDFVGRLAPNRRESIVNSIKPPVDPPGDAGGAAGAVDIETPADELPSPGIDYSSQGFAVARGSTPTNEFLMGLSDEDLENYKQAHIAEIAALEAAGDPPSKVLQDRVTAINMIQGARAKQKGESKEPPSTKDLTYKGYFKERNKWMDEEGLDFLTGSEKMFAESLTDSELDSYISAFESHMADSSNPPLSAAGQKSFDGLRAERENRNVKAKQDGLVDNADLEMGDPDPDGFHPNSKIEEVVNNPDLNDTTDVPDDVINNSADGLSGPKPPAGPKEYREAVYDDEPWPDELITKADPAEVFGDPDFDIDDPKTRVGVLVVDTDTGKVMMRHTKGNYGGYGWTFSKGGIDSGETAYDAAMRELAEETGLSIDDVQVVGALKGSYGGDTSKNYFYIAQVKDGLNKVNIAGNDETDAVDFVSADMVPGFIDKDTTTTTGKARDLQIAGDLDMWVANGGTTSFDGLTFNQAVMTKMDETSGPTKGSGGIPEDVVPPTKHTPSLVPNTEMLDKSKQTGLPLKQVAAKVDVNEPAKREAAAELLADVGVVDALNDPEFMVTDFDLNDEIFDAISSGSVDRYVQIPVGDEGINGKIGYPTRMFRDEVTGNTYVLKKPARNDKEHLSESSAAIVAQDLGLPVPGVTFAGDTYFQSGTEMLPNGSDTITKNGVDTTNRPMIIQPVGNVLDMKKSHSGSELNYQQLGAMLAQQYLIGEPDNGEWNRIHMIDSDGKQSVFAFDAGKAFVPHDEQYGKEFFGSKFGAYIKDMAPQDRKAVIAEAQKALQAYDVEASQKRIRGQVEAGNLTDEEAGRLLEISDFVAQRHGLWKDALGKDFADDVLTDEELADAVTPQTFSVDTPDFTPQLGKTVDPNADPTDPKSYASGIGKIAANMSISQDTVTSIQDAPAQTIVKALNAKRPDKELTTDQTTLDGPDIVGSQMSVTDGMMVNVGTFDNPVHVKATEMRASLEDHSYEQVLAYLEANPDKIYKIKSGKVKGTGGNGWDKAVQFAADGKSSSYTVSGDSILTLTVDDDSKAAAAGLTASSIHGLDTTYSTGNINSAVPQLPVQHDELIVADFGDIKVVLTPDSYGGGGRTKSNMHKQMRVFVTGDTREEMKTSPQDVLERAFGTVGIDATPPTETQIRDTLSRRFLRWTSKPQKNGAPGSTDDSPMYGLGYEKPVIQNTVLKRMADFGITPEDITVRMDSGKPNVVLSPEKAKEIVYAQSGGVGPDDLGNKMPVYAHRFGGGSGLGKLLTGDLDFTDDDADGAIGMLYFDGASSGGLDRTYNKSSGRPSGQSVPADIGNGSSENFYFSVDHTNVDSSYNMGVGTFTYFPDEGIADIEALYLTEDSYGLEHPSDYIRPAWSSTSGGTHFDKLFNGVAYNDYTSKGQVAWNNGVVTLNGTSQGAEERIEAIQAAARRADISTSVLNSQNVVARASGDTLQMLVWEDSPDGVVASWGPRVSRKELLASQMTGRLPEIKTPDKDGIKPWQISSSGISNTGL